MYSGWRNYQKNLGTSFVKRLRGIRFKLNPWYASVSLVLLASVIVFILISTGKHSDLKVQKSHVDAKSIHDGIASEFSPSQINSKNIFSKVKLNNNDQDYYLKLSLDEKLQKRIEVLLKRYKPPYAAFVGLDPDTGAIVAMAGYSRSEGEGTDLCLKSPFRAASIFKLVTSAAAIEKINMGRNTSIGFNGDRKSVV